MTVPKSTRDNQNWIVLPGMPQHINPHDVVGLIPHMLYRYSHLPIFDALDAGYAHGGGWQAYEGFTVNDDYTLSTEEDETLHPWAAIFFENGEEVVVYRHSWVMARSVDGERQVCLMD